MASICLSAVPLLRCPSFSKQQIQFLLIPPALELVFTTTLIFTNWRSGKAFLLLTAEAWLYFALALLDLLVHIIPAVRDNLTIFRSLDIAIAAASFLPLFLYAIFLYIFTTSHLITTLPSRYHVFSKLVLLLLIPSIIALNEISSFIGISYRVEPSGLGVSFNNPHDQSIWLLFTSITLGLVTAYQAISFSFSFFRIAKIFIYQRKIELTSSDEAYLFRGIPYMAGGIKLGAVETVVGFAQGGFGGALTRRILRFLSRAFLCIGIVKGVDVLENFAMVRQEIVESKRVVRRSNLRNLISNPRFSTFQEMTPTATNFHQNPRAFDSQPRAERGLVGMSQLASVKNPRDRVTVHFQPDAAPSLHMRFSTLDLPSPTVIVQNVKSRPVSPPGTTRSSYYPSSVYSAEIDHQTALRTPIYARHTRAFSEHSLGADSIDSLSQFPQLPVPPLPKTADEIHNIREMPWNESYLNSSEPSSRYPSAALPESANILSSRPSQQPQEPLRPPPPARMRYAAAITAPDSASTPRTITSGSAPTRRLTSSTIATTPDNDENPFRYDDGQQLPSSGKSLPQRYSGVDFGVVRHSRSISQPSHLAALPEQPMVEDSATLDQIKRTVGVGPRIKSIGNAPRRSTPKPAKGPGLIRGSIHIEPIMIPPRSRGMPNVELIQEVDTPQEEY